MIRPAIITGAIHVDSRGSIAFANDFDLIDIRRFYIIEHSSIEVIRAWQGHKIESKWFYCLKGKFEIKLIEIDDWDEPSDELISEDYILSEKNRTILFVPNGFVTGFRAIEENSKLIVFSDKTVKESKQDDFRFETKNWNKW